MIRHVYTIPIEGFYNIEQELATERVRVGNVFDTDRQAIIVNKNDSDSSMRLEVKTSVDTFAKYDNTDTNLTIQCDATNPLLINGSPIVISGTTAGGDLSGTYPNPAVFQAHLTDQSAPTPPSSGTLILQSFNQQGFSVPHIYDTQGNAIEITRDSIFVARNSTGSSIAKGKVVYCSGSTGTVPNVSLAKADSISTLGIIGVMYETTANNAFGRVMMLGALENINLSSFSNGDVLYVDATTAGSLTATKPSYPNFAQVVGIVLNNGVGNGVLQVYSRGIQGAAVITDGQALTKVDDTNVTLTLGGTPATSLLRAASLTLGWTGQLSLARGGTNKNMTAVNGGVVWTDADSMEVTAAGSSGQMLRSNGAAAPTWSTATYPAIATGTGTILRADGTNWVATTATYPATTTANQILYSTGTNVVNGSANFVTDGTTMSLGTSTLTAGMVFDGVGSTNGGQRIRITNKTTGTGAYASFDAVSSTAVTTQLGTLSSTYTTNGILVANRGFITSTSTSGISIAATGAGSSIYFSTAGTTQKMQLDANGCLGVGTAPASTQYVIHAKASANQGQRIIVENGTSGTAAYASVDAISSTSVLMQTGVLSNGYTTNGVFVANRTFILASGSSAGIAICTTDNQPLVIALNGTAELYRFMPTGNFKVGGTATRATTEGTNQVVIFNGTAPVGTLTNGCSFYSTAGEMRVMDAAGNATLLSPHEKGTNYWIYDSVDTKTGKHLKIDMEQFMKWLNDKHGLNFVHEYVTNN